MVNLKVLSVSTQLSETASISKFLADTFQRNQNLCLSYSFLFVTGTIGNPDMAFLIEPIQLAHEAELTISPTHIPQRYLDLVGVQEIRMGDDLETALKTHKHAVVIYTPPEKTYDHAIAIREIPETTTYVLTYTNTLSDTGLPKVFQIDPQTITSTLNADLPQGFSVVCYPPSIAT
jgi:hypothetical protein